MTDTLWCIHVQGPDDLIAMPSREFAEDQAAKFNEFWAAHLAESPADDMMPGAVASVTEWDGTPAEHAEALAELRADDPDGWLNGEPTGQVDLTATTTEA